MNVPQLKFLTLWILFTLYMDDHFNDINVASLQIFPGHILCMNTVSGNWVLLETGQE